MTSVKTFSNGTTWDDFFYCLPVSVSIRITEHKGREIAQAICR
jgi:hypothetical protein